MNIILLSIAYSGCRKNTHCLRRIQSYKDTVFVDVSVWELFWWSFVGARVCLLPPGGEKDPAVIEEYIERYRVSTMHFVPSMLSTFLDYMELYNSKRDVSSLIQVLLVEKR